MTKPTSERAFQNFIKDTLKSEGAWYSQLHPGLGSDFGIPDMLLATDAIGILPAELKIGTIEDDHKTIWCSVIRPSQIQWHSRLTQHGYLSCILIGIPHGKTFKIFAVDGLSANKAKNGFLIGEDATEIDSRFFTTELDQWAANNSYSFE